MSLRLILIIILIIAAIATFPVWPFSRGWGVSPVSVIVAVILFVRLLWALGVVALRGVENAIDVAVRTEEAST